MKYYVSTQQACAALSAYVNAKLGYPKVASTKPTIHKDPVQLAADALRITGRKDFVEKNERTYNLPSYANVRKHPTKDEYAYPITDLLEATSDDATLDAAKLAAVELQEDWQ